MKTTKEAYDKAIVEKEGQSKKSAGFLKISMVFITPTFPRMHMALSLPPDLTGSHRRFTIPMSYFGLPSVSVNCGFSEDTLPIGMQIVGNRLAESTVLHIAAGFESATDFHHRRPPVVWS